MAKAKAKTAPQTFPFDVMAWMTDDKVRDMTPAAKGAHIELMCYAWYANPPCCIPDDDEQCARIVRMSNIEWTSIRDSVLAAWPKHRKKWRRQKRLHATFREVLKRIQHKSDIGRRAAEARHRKGSSDKSVERPPDDANALRPHNGRNAIKTETERETEGFSTEHRIRDITYARNSSRGNGHANSGSDSDFSVGNSDSDSGLGVQALDISLVAIRRKLGIFVATITRSTVSDPTIRRQRLADWTDWQQNIEPAIRRGITAGHSIEWFEAQAAQCASLRKPTAVFRKRLLDAGIDVGSAKSLERATA